MVFLVNPCHDDADCIILFFPAEKPSCRDVMPFAETPPATAASGMLCLEYGMSSHRCLFSVIGDGGRCQTTGDKVSGMLSDRIHAFRADIIQVFFRQMKTAPEL